MNVLILEDELEARNIIHSIVERQISSTTSEKVNFVMLKLLQDGIELLEKQETLFDLIVFNYSGTGQALVKCLLQYGGNTAYVMCAPDRTSEKAFAQPGLRFEVAVRMELAKELPVALANLARLKPFGDAGTPDSDFIPLKINTLAGISPVKADIWIRLSENRYIKLIRKGAELGAEDFKKFRDIRRADMLYLKKTDSEALLDSQVQTLKKVADSQSINENEADRVSGAALEAVQDIVAKVGFTPKAQALAKQSVEITLRLLGARPKLSVVLSRLQKEEGKYISSHSITLGKIACALAYKMGWNSAATYLKLSLAAFLHDLPLQDHNLASFSSLEDVKKSGKYSTEQINEFKMHPVRAAEYAKQFHEIPGDVDQVLAQHHEKGDGSGFPRGLTHKYISPLACLFIIAHDMLHFSLEHPEAKLDEFFKVAESRYLTGTFRKIFIQLKSEAEPPAGS
ncbi:MAG: hypothetical protein HY075_06165 [Deltaproteobacteria bacterium]|nr:hypothetical protein [Deltaproteobacteria bacterium]